LIIDPDAVASEVKGALETSGYLVWVAESAAQASRLLGQIQPGLIILDLQLPDVDGLVFCSELRRGPRREVPIIACGDRRRASEGILALRLGADDFIAKPLHLHDVLARVEAVLRRGRGAL